MFLQEIFVIEDCKYYDAMTSNSGNWTIPTQVSVSQYSNTGWKFGNASTFVFIDNTKLNTYITDYAVEFELNELYANTSPTPAFIIYFENTSVQRTYAMRTPSNWGIGSTTVSRSFSNAEKVRVEYTSTTIKCYVDDVLIGSDSHSIGNAKIRLATGASRYCTIKNFKVKPL